jgi:TP901 family phage tail tape measure protein
MARVFEMALQIGAKLSGSFGAVFGSARSVLGGLAAKAAEAGGKLGRMDEAARGLQERLGRMEKLRSMQQGLSGLAESYKKARERAQELGRSAGEAGSASARAAEIAARRAEDLYGKVQAASRAVRTYRGSVMDAAGAVRHQWEEEQRLRDSLRQVLAAQERVNRATALRDRVRDARGNARMGMLGAIETAGVVGAPIKAAMDFESSMAEVRKTVDFKTPRQFAEMRKDILDMTRTLPMAADQIAAIMAAGGQAGIARSDLKAFATDAAKMGVAFDITAESAGQQMAVWRQTFRLSQDGVRGLADQINYLSNNSPVTASALSEIVSRVGSLGGLAGMTAGQVAALGSTMSHVAPEIAATGLKNLFGALTAGPAATKAQAEAFDALGFSAEGLAKSMQADATGTIMSFFARLSKVKPEYRLSMLKDVVGEEGLSALGPMVGNLEQLKKTLKMVGDSSAYAGSMQKEFESRAATTANSLQLAKNGIMGLAISLGDLLLPAVAKGAAMLGSAAGAISSFAEKFPNLTKGLVWAAAAAGALAVGWAVLKFAALAVASPFVDIWALLVKLASAQTWAAAQAKVLAFAQKAGVLWAKAAAAAQWLWNAALSANPIGLVITAVAGLAAAGIALYRNWDTVKSFFGGLWAAFETRFPTVANVVARAVEVMTAPVRGLVALWEKARTTWQSFAGGAGKPLPGGPGGPPLPKSLHVAAHAAGGIFDRPHLGLVAEAGPEAVIPLRDSKRGLPLLAAAGRIMGLAGVSDKPVLPRTSGAPGLRRVSGLASAAGRIMGTAFSGGPGSDERNTRPFGSGFAAMSSERRRPEAIGLGAPSSPEISSVSGVTIHFSPSVQVSAGAAGAKDSSAAGAGIVGALKSYEPELRRIVLETLRAADVQKRRVSFD